MLKNLQKSVDVEKYAVPVSRAEFPQPFISELEFNAPARGMWNIVHTGMLIPESHQIYVCAQGCLRGVILTAAEMNAMDRMSFVAVRENELFDGTMESCIIEGVSNILDEMEKHPRAVLLFLSCVQLFAGCDTANVYDSLRRSYPDVEFIECLMHPTMRKSSLTPDQFMRKQLYAALPEDQPVQPQQIGIIGNDRVTAQSSELIQALKANRYTICDIAACRSYDEYLQMANSSCFISYHLPARAANEFLSARLIRDFLHLPLSYSFEEIMENYRTLTGKLNVEFDFVPAVEAAQSALKHAREKIGSMPIV
ncbi:MAG: nitrogenase, partial [Lentisphaeria bacterium]|nr:nitrogenase [Lentisphaeria bacterium]